MSATSSLKLDPSIENLGNGVVFDEEDKRFIEGRIKEYLQQGITTEDEARKLGEEDCKKLKTAEEHSTDDVWNDITKKINLADFLDDQIRRALGVYKTVYTKRYPEQTIDFRLQVKTRKGAGGRLIAGAALELQYAINGNWKVFRNKEIQFQHIREINNKNQWLLALYEAMLTDLISWGMTYCLRLNQANEQPRPDSSK